MQKFVCLDLKNYTPPEILVKVITNLFEIHNAQVYCFLYLNGIALPQMPELLIFAKEYFLV